MNEEIAVNTKLRKVKNILVSQPKPIDEHSPYFNLAKVYNIKIDFQPFIHVQPIKSYEFKKYKINILNHTAVIFTSRNAVGHFFKLCEASKIEIAPDMKYFCISEQTSKYLQKYITVKKRKVFIGKKTTKDLINVIQQHQNEKFIFPCSDIRTNEIPDFLEDSNYQHIEIVIYKTIFQDLSSLAYTDYDIIACFSPSGINALLKSFPNFKQKNVCIAAFGPTTAQAVKDAGLTLAIEAPLPNTPSMAGALEAYIKETHGM